MLVSVDSICPDPGPVTDGVQSPASGPYQEGDNITFTCNASLTMFGISYLTCQPNTSWDYPAPTCSGKWVKSKTHRICH